MKFSPLLFPLLGLLASCDHIDAVGDKVDELKDMRKESTQGVEGMDIKAITKGIAKTGPPVRDLVETDYPDFIAEPGRLNIVDFHADWCPPCRKLGPMLGEIVEANSHVVRLGKINVDQAKQLAREQEVTSIPDVRFYVDGKLVHKFVGAPPKEELEQLIATHSAGINPVQGATDGFAGATVQDPEAAATIPERPRPANAKPLEETMKPMKKDWLPPGVSQKR